MVALVNYMSQILVELIKLANLIITITKAIACGNRIQSIFEIESSMKDGNGCQDDGHGDGVLGQGTGAVGKKALDRLPSVEFDHVCLTYKNAGAESLTDVSFKAYRGETIGIIGGTGSGKSSLVNLFLIIVLSVPCVLGYNVWSWDGFSIFGGVVLDFEDFLVSNLFLPLGSLVYLLFCVTRYGWGWENYKAEVNTGEGLKVHDWMRGYLTCGLPLIVIFIFLFGIYDKFFK